MKKIAFIGLGNMGGPIAHNIQEAGYELAVFDLDKEKAHELLGNGATWASSVPMAVEDADIVFTSLPGPKQLLALVAEGEAMPSYMKPDSVWVDLSTNNLDVARQMLLCCQANNVALLDAPVSGGTEGAAAGDLTIMIGGEENVFETIRPVFEVIGEDIRFLGQHGAGYVAKIAQVVLCYLHSVALSEALMLGVKGGVQAGEMLNIIQNSTGRSYVADRYGPAILDGSYDPGFALGLAEKDMNLTLELAQSVGATLPMCRQVAEIYKSATESYGFSQNHLMAVRLLEEANNMELRGS
ncbi:MAG: NAD(P)-dependent oxidoreductase [Alphaproteobacteria bacterium]|nr:NAD(P)-dependent oxidoreductase [Alphaproteobacteria bacterium]